MRIRVSDTPITRHQHETGEHRPEARRARSRRPGDRPRTGRSAASRVIRPWRVSMVAYGPRRWGRRTARRISSSRSAELAPCSWASAVTSRRWASTGRGQRLEVVGHDVGAAVGRGPRPRHPHQAERGARRHAERELGMAAGRVGQVDQIRLEARRHVHGAGGGDHRLDVGRGRRPSRCRRGWCGRRGCRARRSRRCATGSPPTPASGTGRAGSRAAGRCPRARSGSAWRSP